MNILNNKTLKEGLDNIFKSDSKVLSERKEQADLIVKNHKEFYKYLQDKRDIEFNEIRQNSRMKKITSVEAIEQYSIIRKNFSQQMENLIHEDNLPLIKNFKETQKPIKRNGFISKPNLDTVDSFNSELLFYRKKYAESTFSIKFFNLTGSEGIILNISVENKNNEILMMTIDLPNKTEDMKVRIIELTHRELLITNVSEKIKVDFLASITEDNILDLDNSEIEDLNLILHDFNFNLSEEPIYQSFKKGFSEFKAIIEKTFNQKKILKFKI